MLTQAQIREDLGRLEIAYKIERNRYQNALIKACIPVGAGAVLALGDYQKAAAVLIGCGLIACAGALWFLLETVMQYGRSRTRLRDALAHAPE